MHTKLPVIIIVLLSLALPASPAQAGGVISVCDEGHLLAALAGGGTVTFTCSGTITLTNTLIISSDTTIDGSGQIVTISGNNKVRVFSVSSGKTLSLNKLTVANGKSYAANGGGIYNEMGIVSVSNSTFSNNSAIQGGGIFNNEGGTVTVSNSTFSNNSGTYYITDNCNGGGITNYGTVSVTNSTFSNNSATNGGGIYNDRGMLTVTNSTFSSNSAPSGGGIYNSGDLTVRKSTFSENSASAGGGIHHDFGTATVSNSTFSGNKATGNGGGILFGGGTVSISNSTFSGNSATHGGGILNGGGIINLGNTIVVNSISGENCLGAITNDGGNLSYPDTTCPGINSDPKLGPLQDNGGPTHTMALSLGSPAIDAAVASICAAMPVNNLDQRGITRPIDGNEDGKAICDIGSFEYRSFRWIYLPLIWKE